MSDDTESEALLYALQSVERMKADVEQLKQKLDVVKERLLEKADDLCD